MKNEMTMVFVDGGLLIAAVIAILKEQQDIEQTKPS